MCCPSSSASRATRAAVTTNIAAATGRWVRNGNPGALAAIAGLAAATVLLRSFMHPLVFVALLAIALLLRRPRAWNGRVIAALAMDPAVMRRSGGTFIAAEVAQDYGIVDTDGRTIPSLRAERGAPIWRPIAEASHGR